MAVLQAYKAELLKDLNNGHGLSPETVTKLCHAIDLSLQATKQMSAS